MDRADVLDVMATLKAAYPATFYRDVTGQELENAVRLWCDTFRGDNAEAVNAAVTDFIASDTKGFPPTIGQIKAKLPARRDKSLEGIDMKYWERQKEMIDQFQELKKKRIEAGIPSDYWEAKSKGITEAEYISMLDRTSLWLIQESL